MDRDRAPVAGSVPEPASESSPSLAKEPLLLCAVCRHAIVFRRDRIEVSGAHAHTFKNPEGVDYGVGCFRHAAGCTASGIPSTVWTWFPGHAWQTAYCGRCGAHLGWSFTGASVFLALILARLIEEVG